MTHLINIPNLLSLSRIVIALVIVVFGPSLTPLTLSSLVIFAVASDVFDGILARVLRSQSVLGGQLDPICDAVFVLGVIYYMLMKAHCSLWYLLAISVRYAVVFSYHYDLNRIGCCHLKSLWSGKWSSGLIMGYMVYYFLYFNGIRFDWVDLFAYPVLFATGLMQVISWYFYYQRYQQLYLSYSHRLQNTL